MYFVFSSIFHLSAILPVCGFNLFQISFIACFNKRCHYTTLIMFYFVLEVILKANTPFPFSSQILMFAVSHISVVLVIREKKQEK